MKEFRADYFDTPLTEAKIELVEGKANHYILRNVCMLAEVSKNGRKYSAKVQEDALSMFEGIKAYSDHPAKGDENRRIKESIGRYKSVKFFAGTNKTYGDLHLVPTKLVTDYIIPIAESDPSLIGSSINAMGRMEADGNVEKITRAFSVDLVTDPATTKGLYEAFQEKEEENDEKPKSKDKGEKTMTLEEILKDEVLMDQLREHISEELDVVASYEQKDEKIKELTEQIKTVEKENAEKLKKVEEENAALKLADKVRATETEITSMLAESKLPEEAKKEIRVLLEKASDTEERKQLLKRMEDVIEGVKKSAKTTSPSVHTEKKMGGDTLSDAELQAKVMESFRSRQR